MNIPHIAGDDDFSEAIRTCDAILTLKGNDYTQGASSKGKDPRDRLKNFYRNAERMHLTPYQVLQVYMTKHLDAIETFLVSGRVESEPIDGRICDAINYLLLLYKMIQIERRACTS